MLTTDDKKFIEDSIKNAFTDFYDALLVPYFDRNEKAHDEILKRLDENDQDHEKFSRKLDRNRDEHDEILEKLEEIEKTSLRHEKRIKKLESIASSS